MSPFRDWHGRNPRGRYRYGTWSGGNDPLAPPLDVRAALDELGEDLLEGATPRDARPRCWRAGREGVGEDLRGGSGLRGALRRLLRNGVDGRRGLDALRRDVRRRR